MRLRLACIALALAGAVTTGGEAAACTITVSEEVFGEEGLSAAERERRRIARERRLLREQVRGRRAAAEAALATGLDAATLLAEMLVPNVRPVFIDQPTCGPVGEIDPGRGRETESDWLAGTRYEGREIEFRRVLHNLDGRLPGTPCNAEFRSRFAEHLRRRLTAEQLREAFLFLGARWPSFSSAAPLARLVYFHGDSRRPPVRWLSPEPRLDRPIQRWARRHASGRAMQRAMDDFWHVSTPLFGDYARVCPAAEAEWRATQARLVASVEAEESRREAAGLAPLQ